MDKKELQKMVEKATINCFKELADNPKGFFEKYELQSKYNNVLKENTNLKQALNEIREYVNNHRLFDNLTEEPYYLKERTSGRSILQIIDKALGDE